MCGFVGVLLRAEPVGDAIRAGLQRSIAALHARGPDGDGALLWPRAALAHTRLAIIDPSPAAAQPMVSPDGRFALVFNGEIYNYRELFHRFHLERSCPNPNSDTAVLLALLATLGEQAVQELDGQYAFALLDTTSWRILLARDRFGEKPLYWRRFSRGVAFASELVALRALLSDDTWNLDRESLALFLSTGTIGAPRTIYDRVHAIEPATMVRLGASDGPQVARRYWWLATAGAAVRRQTVGLKDAERDETVRSLLKAAVVSRSIADVPVGLFLSAGVDSNALLLLAAEAAPPAVALTLDMEGTSAEGGAAAAAAVRAGIPHHRRTLRASTFLDNLDVFFAAMDQPTVDGQNVFFLCRVARELGVKVWLSGTGGDEFFGGYPSFVRLPYLTALARLLQRAIPDGLRNALSSSLGADRRLGRLAQLSAPGNAIVRAYQHTRSILPWPLACRLTGAEATPGIEVLDSCYPSQEFEADWFARASLLEASCYLASQLLRDGDNFSMANGLEVRYPLLSASLAEWVWAAPAASKTVGPGTKPLLIRALAGRFDRSLLARPKTGFGLPLGDWLRSPDGHSHLEEATQTLVGALDMVTAREMIRHFRRGRLDAAAVYPLLVLGKWLAIHSGRTATSTIT